MLLLSHLPKGMADSLRRKNFFAYLKIISKKVFENNHKNVKCAQLTLNNNKMETRETSKDKIFKKIIGEACLLQTNTIYGKQYHTYKPQYPIMVGNELGIFT